MDLDRAAANAHAGARLDADEALMLYRDAPTHLLGQLAGAALFFALAVVTARAAQKKLA